MKKEDLNGLELNSTEVNTINILSIGAKLDALTALVGKLLILKGFNEEEIDKIAKDVFNESFEKYLSVINIKHKSIN